MQKENYTPWKKCDSIRVLYMLKGVLYILNKVIANFDDPVKLWVITRVKFSHFHRRFVENVFGL